LEGAVIFIALGLVCFCVIVGVIVVRVVLMVP
jgi:hypothetical protein